MVGSPPKETLEHRHAEEVSADEREVYLRDGRKLVVSEQGSDQLVEIRSGSGMVEVRILLTEQGPVLQMESVRLQLKAQESVEIESKRVAIKTEEDIDVEAKGHMTLIGSVIDLNPKRG